MGRRAICILKLWMVASTPGKVTFVWNPHKVLHTPIKHTTLCSFFPGMVMNVDVGVTFSMRPPHAGQAVAYPFPKRFSLNDTSRSSLDRGTKGFFPKAFLEFLRDSAVFEAHMAIGIPENDVLPTLSYSDFYDLSSTNKVCWRSINTYICDKYKKRSDAGDVIAAGFVKSLQDNRANLSGRKSVLVVPGFWKTFMNVHEAMKLARSILATSKFKVFVMTTGHRASTPLNAREINPHIMGGFPGLCSLFLLYSSMLGGNRQWG